MYKYQHSQEKSSVWSNAQITMLKWIAEHRQQDFPPNPISVSEKNIHPQLDSELMELLE